MHDVASRSFSRAKAEEPDQFLICLGTGLSFLRGGKYKGKCLRGLDLEAIRPNVNSSLCSLNVKVYLRGRSMAKEPSTKFHQDIGRGNPVSAGGRRRGGGEGA